MAGSDYVVKLQGKDGLSSTINNAKKSVDGLIQTATGIDKIKQQFERTKNSSVDVAKKLKDVKNQMRQLAVEGHSNTALFQEMTKAAQSYKDALDKVDDAIKGVNSSGKTMDNIKGMMGSLTSELGLGEIGSQITSAITNPYVMAGAAIAGAGKALYDYNVELERSLDRTAQFTGLSGDGLYSLRNGIKSVADTFDTDFDTVLGSVDGLMSQFHIDGEEALNIIRDGFVAGANDGGKMLDLIGQFSGSFNDAGISASELVAIIGNTRSGIFNEDGMSAIAMSATKIRQFTDKMRESLEGVGIDATDMYDKLQSGEMSTVQAIQAIANKLKGLNPQSQEVGEVLKQVFGKVGAKAGYELVTALADVESNLEVVKQQTGSWGEAMEQLQEADRELENGLSSLFGIADGGFSTMTTRLKADVYGAVAKVINGFIDWYNKSIIVRGGIANIAMQFKNAWEVIKGILKVFMNAIQSLSEMIEGVFELDWNKVKAGWNKGISSILKNIADGFENVKENISDAADQAMNGKINKLTVPVETNHSENKFTGSKGSGNSKSESANNSKVNKSLKVDTSKIDYETGSLEAEERKLRELQDLLKKTDASNLDKIYELELEIANQQKKVNSLKIKYDFKFDFAFEDMSISDLEKEIKKIDELLKSENFQSKDIEVERQITVNNQISQSVPELNIPDNLNKYSSEDLQLYKTVLIEYQAKMLNNTVAGLSKQISDIDNRLQNEILTPEERESLKAEKAVTILTKAELSGDLNENTINGLNNIISQLQEKLNNEDLTLEERITIQQEIEVKSNKKDMLSNPNMKEGSLGWVNEQISKKQAEIDIEIVGSEKWNQLSQEIADLENKKHKIEVDINENKILNSQEYMQGLSTAIGNAGSAFSSLGSAISSFSDNEGLAKSALIAQAIGQLTLSFAGAMKGTFTPWDWIAGALSGAAVLTSLIASMQKFADGGIVQGSSLLGDNMLARVNPGEMILNGTQQSHLFDAIDNDRLGNNGIGGKVEFKIDGQVIKGVLNNVNKKLAKQS